MVTSESRSGSIRTPLKALCGETTLVSKQAYFWRATSDSSGSNINRHATGGYSYQGTYKNQVPSKSEIALWLVNQITILSSFLSFSCFVFIFFIFVCDVPSEIALERECQGTIRNIM
jgi:hypothetical protein